MVSKHRCKWRDKIQVKNRYAHKKRSSNKNGRCGCTAMRWFNVSKKRGGKKLHNLEGDASTKERGQLNPRHVT